VPEEKLCGSGIWDQLNVCFGFWRGYSQMGLLSRAASVLYGGIVAARGALYDSGLLRAYSSKLPVISVGNVTAGGNGKTPLCLYIVDDLRSRGMKPVILSRGYGGSEKGPYRVQLSDSPSRVGDEPLLMAQAEVAPVYIARSRARGARQIESDQAGDVIVLDDGFQHRALARNVDIVSIFAGTPEAVEAFLAGRLLPEGLFREPRDRALRRASMFVVSERKVAESQEMLPPLDERLLKILPAGTSVYRAYFEAVGVRWLDSGEQLAPQNIGAFAAIANPETFFDSLVRLGFALSERQVFADHHPFSQQELSELFARNPGLPLACTEKDAVKLSGMSAELRSRIAVLAVKLKVVPADAFVVQVQRKLLGGAAS